MKNYFFTLIATFLLTTGIFAQRKTVLSGDKDYSGSGYIAYTVTKKEIKFYFNDMDGLPSIDVDINKNGRVDEYIDRSYGIADGPKDNVICTQYLIDETSSTTCGRAPSKAALLRKSFDIIFTIPLKELASEINPEFIHVSVEFTELENDKWTYRKYPERYGTFGKVYEIKIK